MKKISPYKKCPRCELNYIPREEELCDVCKAELKIIKDNALLSDDEDEILCPVCKQNYISIDDDMCLKCTERLGEKDLPVRDTGEDDWEEFADDEKVAAEDEELDVISLSELEEKEKDEFFEDEDADETFSHPDDFEDEDFDEEDFDDEDFDDEEDFDDDEDIDDEDF